MAYMAFRGVDRGVVDRGLSGPTAHQPNFFDPTRTDRISSRRIQRQIGQIDRIDLFSPDPWRDGFKHPLSPDSEIGKMAVQHWGDKVDLTQTTHQVTSTPSAMMEGAKGGTKAVYSLYDHNGQLLGRYHESSSYRLDSLLNTVNTGQSSHWELLGNDKDKNENTGSNGVVVGPVLGFNRPQAPSTDQGHGDHQLEEPTSNIQWMLKLSRLSFGSFPIIPK